MLVTPKFYYQRNWRIGAVNFCSLPSNRRKVKTMWIYWVVSISGNFDTGKCNKSNLFKTQEDRTYLWLDFSITSVWIQLPTRLQQWLLAPWSTCALNLNYINFFKIPSWLLAVFQQDTVMAHDLFLYIDTAQTTWSFNSANIWTAFGCGLLPISPTAILTVCFPVIRFLNWKVMRNTFIITLYLLWTLLLCYSCFLIYKLWNIFV